MYSMADNFPNLKKEADIQVRKTQRVLNKMSPNKSTPRHVTIKMAKFNAKERILKAAKEKVIYKGIPIRLSAVFFCRKFAGQ